MDLREYINGDFFKSLFVSIAFQVINVLLAIKEGCLNEYSSLIITSFFITMIVLMICQRFEFDFTMSAMIVFLISLSIFLQLSIEVANIAQHNASLEAGQTARMFQALRFMAKEVISLGIGLFLATAMLFAAKHLKIKQLYILILAAIIAIYAILVVFGRPSSDATTTRNTFAGVQLTEVAKLLTVFMFARLFGSLKEDRAKLITTTGLLMVNGVFSLMIHEMGTLLFLAIIYFVGIFVYCKTKTFMKVFLTTALILVAGFMISYAFEMLHQRHILVSVTYTLGRPFRMLTDRIGLMLHPERDPYGNTYQMMQVRKALSLSGPFGSQYTVRIPVKESDLIFVYMITRFGSVMSYVVFMIYVFITLKGLRLISQSEVDVKNQCTALLFHATIWFQSIYIIMASTGFGILTGVPISFLSRGYVNRSISYAMLLVIIICLYQRKHQAAPVSSPVLEGEEKIWRLEE
ncbi:MAG: FtsW/RodA/SpoVE family cell cycle protein [bacterium]